VELYQYGDVRFFERIFKVAEATSGNGLQGGAAHDQVQVAGGAAVALDSASVGPHFGFGEVFRQ